MRNTPETSTELALLVDGHWCIWWGEGLSTYRHARSAMMITHIYNTNTNTNANTNTDIKRKRTASDVSANRPLSISMDILYQGKQIVNKKLSTSLMWQWSQSSCQRRPVIMVPDLITTMVVWACSMKSLNILLFFMTRRNSNLSNRLCCFQSL
jgi:hypothetical protein